jgi:hypothetical protein
MRDQQRAPLPPVERPRHAQLVVDLERALGPERFARAWQRDSSSQSNPKFTEI